MSIAWPTTLAPSLRRPSSGSDLSHAVASPAGVCANCAAPVTAPYCGACGQRDLPHNPSARVLVGELWGTFGAIDGKLVRTVSLLMVRPGALTVEWLRGRREPYLRPLNLYLTVSAAYFAAAVATFRPDELRRRLTPDQQRLGAKARAITEQKYATAVPPVRVMMVGGGRFFADPVEGMHEALPYAPRVMFVLVPLFALLIGRALRSRGWRYPAHLYFALHAFAFYFAVSLAQRGIAVYGPRSLRAPVAWVVGLWTLSYLALAMRRVYGGRWVATGARVACIGAAFVVLFQVGMILDAVMLLGMR